MTIGTTARRTARTVPTVPLASVTVLGMAGGREYVQHDGHEYMVLPGLAGDPGGYVRQPGELLLSDRVTTYVDGSAVVGPVNRRALPVPPGTYARLTGQRAAYAARLAARQQARLMDVLDVHPLAPRKGGYPIERPGAARPTGLAAIALPDRPTTFVPPAQPPRTAAEIVAHLEREGYRLTTTPDARLVVLAPQGKLGPAVDRALVAVERLLVAFLRGVPLPCELRHDDDGPVPAASRICVPDVAACEAHYSGQVSL